MNRSGFLKKSIMGIAGLAVGQRLLKARERGEMTSTYDKLMEQVGFNHLPNEETKTMKSVLHKANTRGHANHGWLDSHHSFSFANYYNPERMHFGVLRVLNDDWVTAGRGFGRHPHDNMEIISIPLEGDLEHKDSMGNTAVIKQGDVQVMSAGTGIYHSEFNKNSDRPVKFLQIWVFPKYRNVRPRYDQITLQQNDTRNQFYQILSPNAEDEGVWIHQDAWFHLGTFDQTTQSTYQLKKSGNGVYAFILEGTATLNGQKLEQRDGYGVWETESFDIQADAGSKILLMEVPMGV